MANMRFINEEGGIEVQIGEGHTAYLTPGSEMHGYAMAGDLGPIAPFVPVPGPTPEQLLEAERRQMSAYRLAWEDAAAILDYGEGKLLDAIDGLLAWAPANLVRRYHNITVFERWRPEMAAFLGNPEFIDLPATAVDSLFRLAMAIENSAGEDELLAHVTAWNTTVLNHTAGG